MMNLSSIAEQALQHYREELLEEEKSSATQEKYLRDIRRFLQYAGSRELCKELTIAYKRNLERQHYAVRSINAMLIAVNGFLRRQGQEHCTVKTIRTQKRAYLDADRELSRAEYLRLLEAAAEREQLSLILQTICSTGIRVSELQYFTVETVSQGEIQIQCKNKTRTILIPAKLRKRLLAFAKAQHISRGALFLGRHGKPIDRSTVWRQMKSLCRRAGVNPAKVFPHNLRKLFARTFYQMDRDIAKLADVLGHSSIDTTRIYIMSSGREHRRQLDRLGLVL